MTGAADLVAHYLTEADTALQPVTLACGLLRNDKGTMGGHLLDVRRGAEQALADLMIAGDVYAARYGPALAGIPAQIDQIRALQEQIDQINVDIAGAVQQIRDGLRIEQGRL